MATRKESLLDSMHTAVVLLDVKGHIEYFNAAAASLFNRSKEKLRLKLIHQLLPEISAELIERVVISQQPLSLRNLDYYQLGRLVCRMDCLATPIVNVKGESEAIVVEMLAKDRQLEIQHEFDLQQQQEALDLMMRGVAHEIKNPLAGIKGVVQLLALELGKDKQEFTQMLSKEVERLTRIVDEMLGPKRILELEPVNLHQSLGQVLNLLRNDQPRVNWVVDWDPSIPNVMADGGYLSQIWLNLFKNAEEALEGQANAQVTIRTRVERRVTIAGKVHKLMARVEIEDNGAGIPIELQEQIFYPMVTTKAKGNGLGLSVSQSLMRRMGGLIKVHSMPGETVFTLYLPLDL
jgi:two-component system nitrogen regulation sensor histidine kinase GlnL